MTRRSSDLGSSSITSVVEGLVAIHDAVRPLVSKDIIEESYLVAAECSNAIASVDAKDSIRLVVEKNKNKALDRSKIKLVQTPQTFDLNLLKQAYAVSELDWFTDDASVFEHFGQSINLIAGDYKNIKITTPEDLELAKIWLSKS